MTTSGKHELWQRTYASLPSVLYDEVAPAAVAQPAWFLWNTELAEITGWRDLERLEWLSGNSVSPECAPIAQAYAGHQFGHFSMLGDGRAVLLGVRYSRADQCLYDVQLKGSGRTRFSRGGDGRAALGPMLREYLLSEAMFRLGVPTTRSLAVVMTGEPVYREHVLPGAVLTRVARSHLRVGTFEYAAAYAVSQSNTQPLAKLTEYACLRHDFSVGILGLLKAVADRQAQLIA